MKTILFILIFVIYFLPQEYAEEKNLLISVLLVMWSLYVTIFVIKSETIKLKSGRRVKNLFVKEIPEERSVIELGYLLNGQITSSLLGVTLMELVRKGALILKYNPKRKDYIFVYNENTQGPVMTDLLGNATEEMSYNTGGNMPEPITEAERHLMEWFLRKIGDGESFSLSMIRRDAYTNSAFFLSCYDSWFAAASFEGAKANLIEPKKDIMEHVIGFVVLSIVLAFFGIILGVPMYLNFISLISTFFLLVYVNMYFLRTDTGVKSFSHWISFAHSIKRGDACNDINDPSLLQKAILYARILSQKTHKMISSVLAKKMDRFENDQFILYARSGVVDEICNKVNKFVPVALAMSFVFAKNKGSRAVLKYRRNEEI